MNKKIVMFLALILSVLSIMGIAVWGTMPEDSNPVRVTKINIVEYDQINDHGDKFKDINHVVNLNNNRYEIHYTVEPGHAAANIKVSASPSAAVNLQVDTENQIVYVYFNEPEKRPTVTITIRDANTQRYAELTLWFKTSDQVTVPDLD